MDTKLSEQDIHAQLPLTEATFLILLALSEGKKHGYAIMKEVEVVSKGRTLLSAGTLYGALGRMLDQAWIERIEDDQAASSKRERKIYILSDLGKRILSAETQRMQSLVTAAEVLLIGGKA